MCIGESHSLSREPVQVRRSNLRLIVVATHISISEVIGKDEEDVWVADVGRLYSEGMVAKERREEQKDDMVVEVLLHV